MAEMREPRLLRAIATLLVTALLCAAAAARTIYVDDDAPEFGDGSSWETAYRYLQDALREAEAAGEPVEIRVARGFYRPDRSAAHPDGTGDREATFGLINSAALQGGYAGLGGVDPNARDVDRYETVLSGDLAGNDIGVSDPCDLLDEPNRADNSYHVVTATNTDPNAVIDGFTITGGNAKPFVPSGQPMYSPEGAGMYVVSGSPTVVNCQFVSNSAGGGGAVYARAGNLTLVSCTFAGNFAGQACTAGSAGRDVLVTCWGGVGGAVYCGSGRPRISDCIFLSNRGTYGGAVHSYGGGSLELEDCLFLHNTASSGGGVYCKRSSPNLVRCTFRGNVASDEGGGMVNQSDTDTTLADCVFTKNWAGRAGGGLASFYAEVSLVGCTFTANETPERGGAIYNWESTVRLLGCLVNGNAAQRLGGGAIYNVHGNALTLVNCTVIGNSGENADAFAFTRNRSTMHVTNCIVRNGGKEIRNENNSSTSITYTNIMGGWPGEGNIDVDPRFVTVGYSDLNGTPDDPNDDFWIDGDYHLKSQAGRWDPVSESWVQDDVTSPCIDAGDPRSPIGYEAFPNGGRINMGAYGGTTEASKSPSGLRARYGGGTGVPNDPYLIYTAEHLNALGAEPDDWDRHFKLVADIDLARYWYDRAVIAPDTNDLEPLFQGTPFTGVFDGGGHTISHLRIEGASLSALFGQLGQASWRPNGEGGEVKNLGLIEPMVFVTKEGQSAGALVGCLSRGTVVRCCVEGGVIDAALGNGVGGLVGSNSGTVTGCNANVKVTGTYHVGGLVGRNGGTVTACHATVTGTGTNWVGGLAGSNSGALVQCFSLGRVNGGDHVGGLTGWNDGTITNCYTTAAASGNQWVGGLSGVNVQRGLHPDPGGSSTGQVYHSYSAGPVSGNFQVGGLCGSNGGSITNCFWDVETSGRTRMCGHDDAQEDTGRCDDSFGLTTAEMQIADTFLEAGWDFVGETANGTDDIWWILEWRDYPRLWWERGDESPL